MRIEECKPGTRVSWFFDTGALGMAPIAGIVLHAGREAVYVRSERGFEGWTYPCRLNLRTWEPERFDGTVPPWAAANLTLKPEDTTKPRRRVWVREC